MGDLPAHASPALEPRSPAPSHPAGPPSFLSLASSEQHTPSHPPPPDSLLSPTLTPPLTPGGSASAPLDTETAPAPALLPALPRVECVVRARIPLTSGTEMFLHLYRNDLDSKEHLAIVFGERIRSRSLDNPRPGESEHDRMMRGAYVGRLYPGRTSSGMGAAAAAMSAGRASPLLKSIHKPASAVPSAPLTPVTRPRGASNTSAGSAPSASSPLAENERLPASASAGEKAAHPSTTTAALASAPAPQRASPAPLVRIHSECYTGETVWSARCDCGEQLDEAARLMSLPSADGAPAGGVIVYLRQEGRGIGLGEKLKAYNLQDLGSDTVEANLLLRHPADARSYGLATAILCDLGLGTDADGDASGAADVGGDVKVDAKEGGPGIRLLTNNPDKVRAVEGPNREVVVRERVAMVPLAWQGDGAAGVRSPEVENYLSTKIRKMGHMLRS